MAHRNIDPIKIQDAHIFIRNFSGRENKYNRAGSRNFLVSIPDREKAFVLLDDGWNVKIPEDEERDPYMQVSVNYENYPPKIWMITGKNKVLLNEETVGCLDSADIKTVDLIINPYPWEIKDKNGVKTGIKAYLKVMYVVIDEDEFASKYAMEESPEDDLPWAEEGDKF